MPCQFVTLLSSILAPYGRHAKAWRASGSIVAATLAIVLALTTQLLLIGVIVSRSTSEEAVLIGQNIAVREAADLALARLQNNVESFARSVNWASVNVLNTFGSGQAQALTNQVITVTNPETAGSASTPVRVSAYVKAVRGQFYQLEAVATYADVSVTQTQWRQIDAEALKKTVLRETLDQVAHVIQEGLEDGDWTNNNNRSKFEAYLNTTQECSVSSVEGCWTGWSGAVDRLGPGARLPNGAEIVGYSDVNTSERLIRRLTIDWNGSAGPNALGEDVLRIWFCLHSPNCDRTNTGMATLPASGSFSTGSFGPVIASHSSSNAANEALFYTLYEDDFTVNPSSSLLSNQQIRNIISQAMTDWLNAGNTVTNTTNGDVLLTQLPGIQQITSGSIQVTENGGGPWDCSQPWNRCFQTTAAPGVFLWGDSNYFLQSYNPSFIYIMYDPDGTATNGSQPAHGFVLQKNGVTYAWSEQPCPNWTNWGGIHTAC